MTPEETEQLRQLIRDEFSQLATVQAANGIRISHLEETAKTLLAISQNLVTLAQSHDERVDKLAATIERYVTGRGTNGTGKKGKGK